MRNLLLSLFAIFVASASVIACSMDNTFNNKPPLNEQKSTTFDDGKKLFDEFGIITKELNKNNPRYNKLLEKSKKNTLTAAENKELKSIFNKYFASVFPNKRKELNLDLSPYLIIIFDDLRCKKCQRINPMLIKAVEEYGLEFIVIKPQDIAAFATQYDVIDNLMIAELIVSYSKPKKLEHLTNINKFPILLYVKKPKAITEFGNLNEFKFENYEETLTIIGTHLSILLLAHSFYK